VIKINSSLVFENPTNVCSLLEPYNSNLRSQNPTTAILRSQNPTTAILRFQNPTIPFKTV